jgi:hypothetical protein
MEKPMPNRKLDLILAIDPGTTSAWSIHNPNLPISKEQLLEHGFLKPIVKTVKGEKIPVSTPNGADYMAVVKRALYLAEQLCTNLEVVIEDQFVGVGTSDKFGKSRSNFNPKSVKVIMRSSGGWKFIAEAAGVAPEKITFIYPVSWQSVILGASGNRGMKRDELKKLSVMVAESAFGVTLTEDEADSVNMGRARVVQAIMEAI